MFLENLVQLMTAASNLLLLISFLRWAQLAIFNNLTAPSKPLTQTQPAPGPLFNTSGASPFFEDIFDGEIAKLSYRLNRTESAVVLFYAPWSRSSLHFKPIFERLATKHAQQNFDFIAINCWQPGAGTCRQAFTLKGGYPYISFFTHYTGHVFYNGVLSESEILLFIYKFTYPFYSAADNNTLAGYRLVGQTPILIVVTTGENETKTVEEQKSPQSMLKIDPSKRGQLGIQISPELFKIGIRSVIIGALSVLVPQSVFPQLRPMVPYFLMPDWDVSFVPQNWTGWLPPIRLPSDPPVKQAANQTTATSEDLGTVVDRGVDRAVVAVVNSFLMGPQLCNPSVTLVKAVARLHNECITPNSTHSDLLSQVTISLAVQERQCQQLRYLSSGGEDKSVFSFKMLQDGGEDLSKLSEIIGLGCPNSSPNEVIPLSVGRVVPLETTFAAVERAAGAGVIFNHSAVGPRKMLRIVPAIYLLDARQERPARLINMSFSEEDASVTHLVDWLKERDRTGPASSPVSKLPKWLPETRSPTLVYYEAPWCIFCSVLTPRIRLAAHNLQRNLPAFRFVRVTDADQIADPTLYNLAGDDPESSISAGNVFSVPHYPSLVFYPHGTLQSVSFNIPHSPGSNIVPAIWRHMPLTDKLLSCATLSSPAACWRRQLGSVRSLQRRLWQRQEELLFVDDLIDRSSLAANCPKRLQLLRFVSRLQVLFGKFSLTSNPFGAYRLLTNELTRFNALQFATSLKLC